MPILTTSVNSYDGTNMRVSALSLCGEFSWGLTYFDEFTLLHLSLIFQ